MMNPAHHAPRSAARRPPLPCYRRLNRQLDQQIVPYTVNASTIVALRSALCREGNPQEACYWLLMARLAELALLCAGHYADCGEIGAAGDLLLNPRRIDIHLRGANQPVVKERHRSLSEQFNPGGLSFPEFAAWFHQNAITNIVEPALLPDLAARLSQSGWLSEVYLNAFQDRLTRVADTMRFAPTRRAAHPTCRPQTFPAGRSSEETHQCRFTAAHYDGLGRDLERICRDPGYHSPYLTHPWARKDTVAVAAEGVFTALSAPGAP